MLSFIARRVRKIKDGKPTGDHPTVNSIIELFSKRLIPSQICSLEDTIVFREDPNGL